MVTISDIEAKAKILHHGLSFTMAAQERLDFRYLGKRRVYSNYDEPNNLVMSIPPEVLLPDSKIPATVIVKNDSPLHVDYRGETFILLDENDATYRKTIDFYRAPSFYGKTISTGERVEQYITKLFGHSIGVFANTRCYFAEEGNACKFCSIKSNNCRPHDLAPCTLTSRLCEAIEVAISCDDTINCIFISGGVVSKNYDSNFLYYCSLAREIRRTVSIIKPSVEITLNSFPPTTLGLIDLLRDTNIAFMLSMEAIDQDKRRYFCPGKSGLFDALGIETILERLVDVAGYGRVLSFVIEGIEDSNTILKGARYWGQRGIGLVSHVLHVDPGTWVHRHKMTPPPVKDIIRTASEMSRIYHEFGLDTSVLYGGRSSLDAEASTALF